VVAQGWTAQLVITTWRPIPRQLKLLGVSMAGAASSWFWPSRAIDRWQQLSVQLYREFAHSRRERANLMRQAAGIRVGGAQELHIHLRGLIRKHKNQRADAIQVLDNGQWGSGWNGSGTARNNCGAN